MLFYCAGKATFLLIVTLSIHIHVEFHMHMEHTTNTFIIVRTCFLSTYYV